MNPKIEEIKTLLKQRRTLPVNSLLDELGGEISNLRGFAEAIRILVRDQGRSTMVSVSNIEELIVKHEIKAEDAE